MNPTAFLALLLVTVAAVGGAVWTTAERPRAVADERAGERLFPAVTSRANDIARIEVTDKGTTAVVAREGDGWTMPEKGGYPVRIEPIRELVAGVAQLTIREPMTAAPERFARIEVQDPATDRDPSKRVVLKTRHGTVLADLVVGRSNWQMGAMGGTYVRDRATNRSWLVQGRVTLPFEANVWMDRQIADVPADRAAAVVLSGGDVPTLTMTRAADGKAVIAGMAEGREMKTADADRVLSLFTAMNFDDVKGAQGLSVDPAGRSAEVTTTDGLVLRLKPVRDGEATLWRLEATATADAAKAEADRINALGGRFVYRLPIFKADVVGFGPEQVTQPARGS
jgi:hypothetical protein